MQRYSFNTQTQQSCNVALLTFASSAFMVSNTRVFLGSHLSGSWSQMWILCAAISCLPEGKKQQAKDRGHDRIAALVDVQVSPWLERISHLSHYCLVWTEDVLLWGTADLWQTGNDNNRILRHLRRLVSISICYICPLLSQLGLHVPPPAAIAFHFLQ